jgi:hypothetical protein
MDESVGGGITYRYLAKRDEAIYPFGHGLSYTTFAYSDFKVITESESSSSGKKKRGKEEEEEKRGGGPFTNGTQAVVMLHRE